MTEQVYEPGDKIRIVIEGTIPVEGIRATNVAIRPEHPRPGDNYPNFAALGDWTGFGDAIDQYGVANARVSVTKTSRYKNGVHIDLSDGTYWLRRPDGWHFMAIGQSLPPYVGMGTRRKDAPTRPQRLKEDR